jgi:hypothetical protein
MTVIFKSSVLLAWRDANPKGPEAPQEPTDYLRFGIERLDPREALSEPAEDDLPLGAGERRPEAVMDSQAEAKGMVVGAPDVEAVGIRESLRIAVRGAQEGDDALIWSERDAFELGGLEHVAGDQLNGAVVAKHLLHRGGDQAAVVPQPLHLAGMP